MKKLILMAIVLVTLATTVNAATWTCTDSKYDSKVLLSFEVEDTFPSDATITLRGQKIEGWAFMEGLDMWIAFGDPNKYRIVLQPDNYALYLDFTDVPKGEKIKPSAVYYCKQK